MNLVPLNKLVRSLGADVCTLPAVTGLGTIILDKIEVLVLNSEDIRCFFYLFGVPREWHKCLAFGREVPPPFCHVIALNLIISVLCFYPWDSFHQCQLHNIFTDELQDYHYMESPRVLDPKRNETGQACKLIPWLYRIYLDNFDALEKVDCRLASLIKGEPSVEAMAMRDGYQSTVGLAAAPEEVGGTGALG